MTLFAHQHARSLYRRRYFAERSPEIVLLLDTVQLHPGRAGRIKGAQTATHASTATGHGGTAVTRQRQHRRRAVGRRRLGTPTDDAATTRKTRYTCYTARYVGISSGRFLVTPGQRPLLELAVISPDSISGDLCRRFLRLGFRAAAWNPTWPAPMCGHRGHPLFLVRVSRIHKFTRKITKKSGRFQ
ncbi:ORFL114W [Human betaherpesvirus 5]|nr:ORFL114W [Human betaherpesvirus 5]QHX40436.1 ORFL114W [Human betaherpesvirus 5]